MPKSNTQAKRTSYTLGEIAALIGGECRDSQLLIHGACGVREASEGEITYISNAKFEADLRKSKASAVILPLNSEFSDKPSIRVEDPAKAFLKAVRLWATGAEPLLKTGIHPTAYVDPGAQIGKNVYLGPYAVVGEGSVIGDGCSLLAHTVVGEKVQIGTDVLIYENCTIRDNTKIDTRVILHAGVIIGSDGFGYETIDGAHVKVPQQGNVWIQEDVEIGAGSCVDRARFGSTVIGKGTKIDNLVQIAHNVKIGQGCLIISQVGIAGSSELGDYVILAGQVGVSGHVRIGDKAIIGAQSGVFTHVEGGQILLGSPPLPIREEKERIVYNSRLPKLFKEFKEIKKNLG